MGKEKTTPTERYATKNEGEFGLMPGNPVFPPDFIEDGQQDPQPAYIQAHSKKHSEIEIDVTEGNAPLQVHFNSGDKEMAKDLIWIGETKKIKIPYAEGSNDCNIYFLRRLNKGICKGTFKLVKE